MKKFLLSALVLIVFTVYAIHTRPIKGSDTVAVSSTPSITRTRRFGDDGNFVAPSATSKPTPMASASLTTSSTAQPTGKYKNGTYTGSVADAFYGNIQVQVVISGGKITDVIFLQYPSDRRTSIEINSQAMPFLKQEAIAAQSAQVDGVSGATATSQAFIESLTSALQQAG